MTTSPSLINVGRLTVLNCVIRNNKATSSGGGIYNANQLVISGTLFTSNTATSLGGGVYNFGGSSTLTSCSFISNSQNAIANLNNHTALLNNCLLQSNTASGNGGGIYNFGGNSTLTSCSLINNASASGGAIFNAGSHTVSLSSCVLQSNTASSNGGAIYNDGGISMLTSCSLISNQGSSGGAVANVNGHVAVISSCVLQSNSATTNGGTLYSSGGSSTLTSCSLTNSQANYGGAIYSTNHTATLSNCMLQSNTAVIAAGGHYCSAGSKATLVNVAFDSNVSSNAGAVFAGSGTYVMTNTSFRGNMAEVGTVLLLSSATVRLTNGVMFGNGLAGNAISGGTLQATYTLFEQNTSGFTADPSNLTTAGSPFANSTGTELAACSPAIDAGNNAATGLAGITVDLATNPRFFDGGTGTATVDMGAYEFQADGAPPVSFSLLGSGTATCAISPTLTLSGSQTGVSYQLRRNGVDSGTALAGTGLALSFGSQPQSGTYTVLATSTSNSCTLVMPTSASVISTSAVISVSLVASRAISCSATSVTLTASPANLTYTFGNGATQLGTTNRATVNAAGTYSVTVSDASGCSAVAQVAVTGSTTAPASPTLTASNGGTLTCGQPALTLTASATGPGLSYSFVGGGVLAQSGNSATINAADTYSVIITGDNSCTALATTTVVSDTAPPSVSLSPTSATLSCVSPTVTLTATSSLTNYRFSTGQNGASNTLLVTSAGTYSVIATGANGCTNVATAVVESATAAISASLVASGVICCSSASVTLTASPASLTYSFSSGATQLGSTNQATVSAAGTYSVTVSDAGGCSAVAQVTVSESSQPVSVSLVSSGGLGCEQSQVSVSAVAAGATSFTLLAPTGSVLVQTSGVFSVNVGGSYTVVAQTTVGCKGSATLTIQERGVQPKAVNFRASGVLGPGSCTVRLLATGTGNTFVMTGPGGYVFSNTYRNVGTYDVFGNDVRQPGTYTLTVYSGSCVATYTAVVTGTACP